MGEGREREDMIVHSGSGSLIYKGDESVEVRGIFWFSGPYESSG